MYNEDEGRSQSEGAGYYRVRINKVTYYLGLSPQRKSKKQKENQRRTTIKEQSTSGDSEEAVRFEGNRPTPRKADAAAASFSIANEKEKAKTCRESENLDRFPVAAKYSSSANVRPIIPS
jgi:hypothetical protein